MGIGPLESDDLGRHLLVILQAKNGPQLLGQLDLLQANDSLPALESNTRQLLEQQGLMCKLFSCLADCKNHPDWRFQVVLIVPLGSGFKYTSTSGPLSYS